MSRRLSADAEALLDRKTVNLITEVRLNSVLIYPINYQYSYDRDFGAAALSMNLENDDGKYSVGGSSEIKFGDTIELKEGMIVKGTDELFTKFTGIVRETSPQVSAGGDTIMVVKCLDNIVKLEDMDIDITIESTNTSVSEEILNPIEMVYF